MKEILGHLVEDEYFDYLMCEQNKNKDLKVSGDKVVAVEHEVTQEELLQEELKNLYEWFDEYDNQVKQYERCQRLGITFDKDINLLDNEAREKQQRIAEIRNLLKGV